jgi:HSP20 family protein
MALPTRRGANRPDRQSRPTRWLPTEPFAHFEDIYRRTNEMMRTFAEGVDLRDRWSTPVDIEETDEAYLVEVDLPGVAARDLVLEWNDQHLTLHGEVRDRDRTGLLRQQTRRIGRFDYTVTLPGPVDGDRITATLTDGLLTVHAPKAASARGRRIEISDKPAGQGDTP